MKIAAGNGNAVYPYLAEPVHTQFQTGEAIPNVLSQKVVFDP
jgi:hypothetical protein